MKTLQFQIITLITWLFLLFNIERFTSPINIASFVYVYIAMWAMLIILVPVLRQKSFIWLFLFALPAYFGLRAYFGYPIDAPRLPIIVTEICAIGITVMLTGSIGKGIDKVQQVIASVTIGDLKEGTEDFERGQGWIYREIRRARIYKHPATLLVISPPGQISENIPEHIIREAQSKILNQFLTARIARLLRGVLRDCDVVTQRDDDFIVLLPETDGGNIKAVSDKLIKAAREELGIDLQIGASTFPEQAVTFESMLLLAEKALSAKKVNGSVQQRVDSIPLSVGNGANGAKVVQPNEESSSHTKNQPAA